MGEALRKYTGKHIHTYIAAQAALSAHYYDNTISATYPVSQWTYAPPHYYPITTPDIFGHYFTGDSSSNPYFADNSNHVVHVFNYYNSLDWALDLWEQNNVMKPDDWTPYLFFYDGRTGIYQEGVDQFARGPNDDPVQIFSAAVERERYQIFSYTAESRSKGLGQPPDGEFISGTLKQNWTMMMSIDSQRPKDTKISLYKR